jgi:prophage antirepressor-like protein
MDILKAFSLFNEEHQINIQGTLEEPLFQANQIGQLLGIVKIRNSLTDFDNDEKVAQFSGTLGGTQEMLFLTEIGLYKLLGRSRKPIASVFQKWMINTLKEIRINGMYQLQKERDVDKKLLESKCKKSHHNTLLKAFHRKKVIYICKLKDVDETHYIIKMGSSQDLKTRIANIAKDYSIVEPLLLDVFESNNQLPFENFLHNHKFISQYHQKQTIQNNISTRETYLVNDEQYAEFIKIINENKSNFEENSIELEEVRLKYEQLRNETEEKIIKQKELDFQIQNLLLEKEKVILRQRELENEKSAFQELTENDKNETMPIEYTPISIVKKRNNSEKVPKVYKYSPQDLSHPIKVYDSPVEAEREENISNSALKNASNNHTIYKDFRWIIIPRNENPPETIPDTIDNKNRSTEIHYIAMIDIKKTKILQVFATQKEAAEARNMRTNGFSRAIKEGTQSSGHYWNYFENCSEEMKEEYLKTNQLPEKFAPVIGKRIQQIDPRTNAVLKTYPSKREVLKLFQISNVTLDRLVQTDEIYKGYKWKYEKN